MVRFGAEMVFSSKDSTITDEDIDRIIAKGEEATAELDAKMKKFTEDAIKFKMDASKLPTPGSIVLFHYLNILGCYHLCKCSAGADLYDFEDEKVDSILLGHQLK